MTDFAPVEDPAALTRYIETRYHVRHRAHLPKLAARARQVEDLLFPQFEAPAPRHA